MFESRRAGGVLQLRRPGARWLSTGFDGGRSCGPAAYVLSVPAGFERSDLAAYRDERLAGAGFEASGPALLTGVDLDHARGAHAGPVEVVATAGVSNPAALPMDPGEAVTSGVDHDDPPAPAGTVNVVVGTTRALTDGALANLVAVAAEAKAATLLAAAGVPGTTSDAVVAACDPDGEPTAFSGSATPVGAAARACVREAVAASFRSRYDDEPPPDSVADAEYGVVTDERAEVFVPG
jgi:adenosylcobinamide hydrolase